MVQFRFLGPIFPSFFFWRLRKDNTRVNPKALVKSREKTENKKQSSLTSNNFTTRRGDFGKDESKKRTKTKNFFSFLFFFKSQFGTAGVLFFFVFLNMGSVWVAHNVMKISLVFSVQEPNKKCSFSFIQSDGPQIGV